MIKERFDKRNPYGLVWVLLHSGRKGDWQPSWIFFWPRQSCLGAVCHESKGIGCCQFPWWPWSHQAISSATPEAQTHTTGLKTQREPRL